MKRILITIGLGLMLAGGFLLYRSNRNQYYIVGYKTTITTPTNSLTYEGDVPLTTRNGQFNYMEVKEFIAKKYIESAGLTNHGNIAFTFIYKL